MRSTKASIKNSKSSNPNVQRDDDDFEIYRISDTKDFLHKSGVLHWCGDINRMAVEEIVQWILAHNMSDTKAEALTLIITSYGGVVDFSFGITDMMMGSTIPIRTVGLGVIASAGLMIFMAGHKGSRILSPNTSILSHQFSGGDYGKEHELLAGRTNFDQTSERIMRHYKKCTGLSEKKVRECLLPPQDVWLNAEDALKLNICDEIRLIN